MHEILDNRLFPGTVVDNRDPERLGRVRVSIKGLTDVIPKDDLPWYIVLQDVGFGLKAELSGHRIPDIGTQVGVNFPWGDIYNGTVSSKVGWDSETVNKFESLTYHDRTIPGAKLTEPVVQKDYTSNYKENYPNSSGFFDALKNWYRLDKLKRTFELVCKAFNMFSFKIDSKGNISLHVTGKLKILVDNDVSIEMQKNCEIIVRKDLRYEVDRNVYSVTLNNKNSIVNGWESTSIGSM